MSDQDKAECLGVEDARKQIAGDRWIIICDDGQRSAELAAELSERGPDVAYLDGGMQGWAKEKLPTQPPESDNEREGPKNTTLY